LLWPARAGKKGVPSLKGGTWMRVLMLVFAICLGQVALATSQEVPKVFFEYGYPFDLMCSIANSKSGISDETQNKAKALVQPVDHIWTGSGPKLLTGLTSVFDSGFARKELSATLILCPGFYATSHPLLLNVFPYLKKGTIDDHSAKILVNTIFHEIIHRYLDDLWGDKLEPKSATSLPLIKKYKDEDGFTLAHIHLFAIQKTIYRNLGKSADWDEIVKWANGIPQAGYQRALDIVEKEGADKFVSELNKNK
jgi:hypothetical protein